MIRELVIKLLKSLTDIVLVITLITPRTFLITFSLRAKPVLYVRSLITDYLWRRGLLLKHIEMAIVRLRDAKDAVRVTLVREKLGSDQVQLPPKFKLRSTTIPVAVPQGLIPKEPVLFFPFCCLSCIMQFPVQTISEKGGTQNPPTLESDLADQSRYSVVVSIWLIKL